MSGWLHDERRIVGRGGGAVDDGSWYWRVGGRVSAGESGSCLMYVRERTRLRELLFDDVAVRPESEDAAREESDDRG